MQSNGSALRIGNLVLVTVAEDASWLNVIAGLFIVGNFVLRARGDVIHEFALVSVRECVTEQVIG